MNGMWQNEEIYLIAMSLNKMSISLHRKSVDRNTKAFIPKPHKNYIISKNVKFPIKESG